MPFAMIGFFLCSCDILTHGVEIGQWNLNKTIGWTQEGGEGYYNYIVVSQDSLVNKLMNGGNSVYLTGLYLLLVILCMIFARSAAMSFNRYLDRSFDAKNPIIANGIAKMVWENFIRER